MMAEKLKDFQAGGFLRECTGNLQWVARAFLVPKPGNNKWRLVIDYRWLNSQLKGKNFPLPFIEDQLANQHGNFLFTLLDLEDGFHQMHLEEVGGSIGGTTHVSVTHKDFAFSKPWCPTGAWLLLMPGLCTEPAHAALAVGVCPQTGPQTTGALGFQGRWPKE